MDLTLISMLFAVALRFLKAAFFGLATFVVAGLLASAASRASGPDSVYQWSTPVPRGFAYLWVPEDCVRVRAVVVGQRNMSEEPLFQHPKTRAALRELGFAIVWISPILDPVFDFGAGAGERFEATLNELAEKSGYEEIATAPVVPIGHSACASYPWNFAAWKPERTLAAISLHGDAPLTNMTGSGRPNPDWGDRTMEGVPGLMMMAEYEWLEGRLSPLIEYRKNNPRSPIAMLAEPGTGHFDVSEDAIDFMTLFLRKVAAARLPVDGALDGAAVLRPIDARDGWLAQRWNLAEERTVAPAPFAEYTGDRDEAFWAFDEEMALANHRFRSDQIGKRPQLLGFRQDGKRVGQTQTHDQVGLAFEPLGDGLRFRLDVEFLDTVDGGSTNTTRWTGLSAGAAIGHPDDASAIRLSRITGPVEQVDARSFTVSFDRAALSDDRRRRDVWLLASHEGDGTFKSARQQALMVLPTRSAGEAQRIDFAPIPDQVEGGESIRLLAKASSGLLVGFFVRDGPAYVDGEVLRFGEIPPRAKYPISVTVVAWQFGRGGNSPVQEASMVERTFRIVR